MFNICHVSRQSLNKRVRRTNKECALQITDEDLGLVKGYHLNIPKYLCQY